MALSPPPIQEKTADSMGFFPQTWVKWFSKVYSILAAKEPFLVSSYTVATLPDAAEYLSCVIYITNETGGAVLAFSDGINWRRVTDRAIVS